MVEAATATEGTEAPEAAEAAEADKGTLVGDGADASKETTDTLLAGAESEGAVDGDESAGPPEAYKFDVPDDLKELIDTSKVDQVLETFGPTAKELGLSQDQFQKLIEFDVKRSLEAGETALNEYEARVKSWAEQTKADPNFGGQQLEANLKIAELGLKKMESPGLVAALKPWSEDNPEGLGLGNHPEVIKLLHKLGTMYAEPDHVRGEASTTLTDQERLKRMYPSMFKEAS